MSPTAEVPAEERRDCPLCGCERLRIERHAHPTWGRWRIDTCESCGFHFTNPRPLPDSLPSLYADLVFDALPNPGTLLGKVRRARLGARLKRLWPLFPSGRLRCVDIGAGDGFFSRVLAEQPDCEYVVAADFFDAMPRALVGVKGVAYQGYSTFYSRCDMFGLVFCWFVLEHVLDPNAFVARLSPRLREGGTLVIEVPNWRAAWRRLLGSHYSELSLPMHLNHFDPSTIARLFPGWSLTCFEDQHGLVLAPSLGRAVGHSIDRTGIPALALLGIEFAVDSLIGPPPNMTLVARKTTR